ncbi:lipopolysaccharide biosynthesis protein [Methylophilus sp. Leaf408]|uniref:lipopolysaccharide biosynthesis protein n=1 Tax=Methylophilus sp. Leaf408 TaxID=2876561 RepID=UPI001E2DCCF2|nr:oligosaccharide flippase family protein [Methylophilus sp. Leaf408]
MLKTVFKSRVFGNTALYTLANVLNGAIPFLLLPVLTRVFTPEEYGLVTLISLLISILGAFTGLSIHGAVSVNFFNKSINHPRFVGSCVQILIGSTSLTLLIAYLFSDQLSQFLHIPKHWLLIATVASAAQFIINIRLTLWQVKEQALHYSIAQVSQTVFNISLSLALVFWLFMGWEGRALGIVLSSLFFCALALLSMQNDQAITWRGDRSYTRKALLFGVPLIPHVIGGLVMAMSDRFFIAKILDTSQVGIFTVALQVSLIINFIVDGLLKSYSPELMRQLQTNNEEEKLGIVKKTYWIFGFLFLISTLYIFVLPFVLPLIVGDKFNTSITYVPWLVYAGMFSGLYYLVGLYIVFVGKTHLLSIITLTVSLIHCALLYLLIHTNGLIGAAQAVLISSILMFVFTWLFSSRVYPMKWLYFFPAKVNHE